jgi:hypothetical protein
MHGHINFTMHGHMNVKLENMCIEENNFVYRDGLWGQRTAVLDVKYVEYVLIPSTLIHIVGGLPQCKNKW